MPGGDGTGPLGLGSRTGWGCGPCGGYARRGFGRWQRWTPSGRANVNPTSDRNLLQQQLQALENQERLLQQDKESLKKRIEMLG